MRLSEALTAQGLRGTDGPISEESLYVVCEQCDRKNVLTEALVSEPSANETIYSCAACSKPILRVAGVLYQPFGLLGMDVPNSFVFGKPEGLPEALG